MTVTNSGNTFTGALTVGLSDANAVNCFAITEDNSVTDGIDVNSSGTFTIAPATGLNAGTYTARVTVGGDNGIIKSFNVSFTVNKATPTKDDLVFKPGNAVYSGEPQPVTVTVKAGITGFGAITGIRYNGSTDLPTTAGEYDVTVDVTEGDNYFAKLDLLLGKYEIKKVKPTVDDLDFDLSAIVYNGRPLPVGVVAVEGIDGLSEITVKYNGFTDIPNAAGMYAVTVDIAGSENYDAIEGLLLGYFTVYESPQPSAPGRRIQLPSVAGMTTVPSAGLHYVSSGADFVFTLTPADGTPPAVQTSRTDLPDADNILVTPNGDGSYTVVIHALRQNVEITISAGTDSEGSTGSESVAATLTVYAVPGAIAVENARTEAVVLRVYTLAGALVHRTAAAPGTTRLTVAPGIYIVVTGDGRWKLMING